MKHIRNKLIDRCFIMSVDVDGWSSLLKFYSVNHEPSKADLQVSVEDGISRLLRLFEQHKIKTTFFVTGEMAQKHSEAIKMVRLFGHEIACHGLTHGKNECLLDRKEQERRIREATRIIEKNIGYRPRGFRAPCLRANKTTLEILDSCGYLYDSSIITTFIPGYYGTPFAPPNPYHPLSSEGSYKLLEIPISVNPLIPLPLSGGWMRNLGLSWVKFGIKINFILGRIVLFYIHPRDVIPLPFVKGIPRHLYRNLGNQCIIMLDNIIKYAKVFGAKFKRAIDFAQICTNYNDD